VERYDVIIVGSGAAGLSAALRATKNGLSVLIVEKAHQYGGTSATSGGVLWIPNHGLTAHGDSREKALQYLANISRGPVRRERQEAFVDAGPRLVRFLAELGLPLSPISGYPDYFSEVDGAHPGRALIAPDMDGALLGEDFYTLREAPLRFRLLTRFSLGMGDIGILALRLPGWRRLVVRILWKYWSDIGWRIKTHRDRRLTMGNALIGGLRKLLNDRKVPLWLGTALEKLVLENGRVVAAELVRHGHRVTVHARYGIIIAAGGFEWSQPMRDKYLTLPGSIKWSATPENANTGDCTRAAQAIGAATEFMETMWWNPNMVLPVIDAPNIEMVHIMTFDHTRPHTVLVNQNGVRFVNECRSYDRVGTAMLEDYRHTGGANAPCWMIFDVRYRRQFPTGGLMPSVIMPDRKIPKDWWDHYIFRANTIAELAAKIELDPSVLAETIRKMNEYAKTGVDTEFGRGNYDYDKFVGVPTNKPNPCIGSIEQPPFYAVPVLLGDIGSKGGLKADARARVLDEKDQPIPGLYAVGNASGAMSGDAYPGAGGTIGPAMVFGFIAADDIQDHAVGVDSKNQTVSQPAAARVGHAPVVRITDRALRPH